MNYFLQIEDAAGKIRLVPIADIKNIPVIAGDNIIVMDEQGNPVDVSLRPDGKNLVIDFKNGESVILDDFYNIEEGAEPITISLNPKEPVDAGYEFNSQTGNLPNAKSFTLMRFSNTEYVNFVEQIDELSIGRSGGLGAPSSMGGGGGSGGNENMAPDAVDDTSVTDQNTTLVINVLGNDSDPNPNDALIISGVDQPDKGSVTVNSSSQIVFDPGDDFDYLGAGESAIVTFNYSIFDGNGGTDTATVTLTVNGVDDVTDTTPDTAVTDENTPITINVLANDSDSDANDVLTIDSVTQPAPGFGSVINNGTDLTFDPGSDFDYLAVGETATVTFTYTTNTGITETVTVTINGVNDAPVAFDDAETTDQDSTVNIDLIGGDGSISPDWDPDGDVLVISQINGVIAGGTITLPSGALVTVNANGTVDYNPNGAFDSLDSGESAIDTFSYTISDGNGGTATATATVTVNGIEDATVTAPDAAVTNEDTPVTIDVLANDTDPDTSDIPLTITSVTQPALGTVVNNGSNVTFNPGGDFQNLAVGETATVTFTYTTDTGATENVTVTINGVNDGPDAIDDARTTDQDTPLVIDAISNDNDADTSDTLLITGVDQPSRGTASVNSSNQIAFDPGNDFDDLDAGESATVTFNYSISDGHGGTDTATITVTVNGMEDATVTAPDAAVTNEDTPIVIDVLANDTDPDTSDIPLTITSVTQPALGTVVNNGSNVTFNPGVAFNNLATGETATVTFTYTTDTGATENVTVTINGTNDAPDAINDARTTDQDTPLIITALSNDTDPDASDVLLITGVDQPVRGSASINASNQVVFDPGNAFDDLDAGESATVTFNYSISDGHGGTDTATITVTVNGVEDATVTAPDAAVTNEDTPVVIDVLANDTDPDTSDIPLTITSVTQPALGTVVNNGSNVTFNPGAAFNNLATGETATVTFTYTTDTGATENVTVTINGTNDAPDAINDARTTNQDTPLIITALSNDTDPDASDVLIITGVTQPSKGTVTYNAGDLTFNPGNDFDDLDAGESATVTFNYSISDGHGGTDTATITVTVNGVEDATVTAPDAAVTNEDTPIVIDVLANDTDPDTSDIPLTITSVTQPALGTVVNNGSNVTFNPGAAFNNLATGETATVTFTYTTDTGATENVTVTINGTNDAPDAINDARTTNQDTPLIITALSNDTDPDASDVLIITGVTQPSKGTVTYNAGDLTFNPGNDFDDLDAGESATVTFNYSISDGHGGTDTATITVTVNGVEDATVTAPDAAVTNEDTPIVIDVLANDTDPDTSDIPLTITSVTQPALGTVVNNGSNVTFNPGAAFNNLATGETATVTFTYTTDTGATENVTVTINGTNDAPDAINDARTTNQDTPLMITALSNDTDPDASDVLIITGVTQPSKGTVTYNAGDLTFNPGNDFDDLDAGESATVTFNYSISDGNGGTDTATITITVNGVEDATDTAPDAAVTNEDTPIVIDVLANDTDPDTSDIPLTITSVTQPALGTVVNNGSNVTFNPGVAFNNLATGETATVTFTYTTDTGATENVTVTINGTNDAPDAINDARTTDQDTPLIITALSNDTDPDASDVLLITGVDQPVRGSASINANNQVVFDPGNDFDDLDAGESATVTFNYSISDGHGGTDTATITVTVNGVEDATVTAPDAAVTNEDTPIVIDVLANDTDPDTSDIPLTITSVTQPALGTVINNGSNVTFNPGVAFNNLATGETATVTFTYTTDTGATENVTVTINGTNDAPDAINDARTTDQDTPLIITALSNDTDPDASDVLLITGVDQPVRGSASINANNQVVFDPGNDFDDLDAGESATVTFNYSISDGHGGTDTATITVTVNGVEDATVTAPDAAVTNEDTPIVIDVLANDTDPDTSDIPLTITSVTQPALGTVINNGSNVTFNPGVAFNNLATGETATVTFTYTTDTGATENVTVTINGTNDAPDAINDARTTDQDTPLVINAIGNDTDPDVSDVLLITGVDQPARGSASVNASNQVVFDPGNAFDDLDAGESATVTFNYSISDGHGGTDTATITVTVNGVEDATITAPDAAVTNEDTPVIIDVLANDTDPDTSDIPLTITSVTQPALGTVVNNGTNVTFNPGAAFNDLATGETATVTFTYTTDTGATENVTVTINGTNDAPDAIDDARTTDQNTPLIITALSNDTDPDASDVLIITGVTQPSKGTATYNAGDLTFNPGNDFDDLDAGESATVTFNYSISDGNGGTDTATITVTVNGIEDATDTAPDADVTNEDTPIIIDVLANDTDPDTSDNPLTVTGITQPPVGQGTVAITSGGANVTFTPGAAFNYLASGESTTTTFTYTTDTGATENVTVTINGTNDAPDAINDARTTNQDTPLMITALSNDTDPDASDVLIITGVTQPSKGTVTYNAGDLTFNPGNDFDDLDAGESATVTFNYSISDGHGGTDTATITVTVNGVEDATDTAPDAAVTNEDTPIIIDVLANDTDPDTNDIPLSITSVTQPPLGQGTVAITNGGADVTFDPGTDFQDLAAGETATVTFTYTTDTGATENVTVTINGTNDGPDAIDDARTTDQDTPLIINAISNDTDPDTSDVLLITGVDTPARGSASINSSNQIVFDPGNDFDDLDAGESATVTFNYSISDGNGGTDTATITVTVNGVEDATDTAPDAAVTNEDTPIIIDVLANDTDPDTNDIPLSITSVTQPPLGQGTVAITNGGADVTFDPGTDFQDLGDGETATVNFTYTTDTGATENVTVTINGTNDGPDAINDARSTSQNTAITINAISNDTDPDTSDVLLITGVDTPARGSASINSSNQIVFDPGNDFDDLDAGESATVTFNYSISDGNGGTDTATITVTVNGVEDATDTAPDAAVTNEDTPIVIDVLANDTDPDTSDIPLSITSVTQPPVGQGTVAITNGGADVTFTPGAAFNYLAAGESATTTFTYTTDTGATENVTVTINGVNDAPDAINDARSTNQNTAITINAISNDTDPDTSDVLLITGVNQPARGSASINVSNQIVFDPGNDFDDLDAGESATVTFNYSISDGSGGTDTATITVTVNGVEDATVTAPDAAVTNENTPIVIDVLANDSDPDTNDNPLTVTGITQPPIGQGTVAITNGGADVTFTPGAAFDYLAAGESATTTFTYTTDTGITETVTVTVNGLDDPTVTQPDAAVTDEDSPVTINVLANDSDPDTSDNPLTIGSFTQPIKGSITSNGTSIVFDPGSDFQNLTSGDSETVTFTYTTDTGITETVTVTVNGNDDEPLAVDDTSSTNQTSVVNINLLGNDSDPDGNALSVVSINGISGGGTMTLPSGALLTLLANGTVNYNPNGVYTHLDGGESATDTFTYVISDGSGGSDTATVTVTINGVEDALNAGNDVATTFQSTPIFINTLVNDSDPDTNDNPLTVIGVSTPALGLATFTPSGVAFNPNGDFNYLNAGQSATVTFNYTVENANGDTDTASVTVTVLGSNDPTITNPDTAITNEDTPVGINVLANDSDPDANQNPLTITSITQPALGLVTNNGTNLTFNPDGDFEGLTVGETATVTFTYTTNTGVIEDVTVTITGVNDAPVANDDIVVSTTDILPVSINVISNDTDIDGTVVASSVDLNPGTPGIQTSLTVAGEGTWTTNGAGLVTFTPLAGITDQPTPITYEITDNNGGTSQAIIDLKYSAADVWFGNDESGSVNNADFTQSRVLISGAADQMTFATGSIAFNAALFTWSGSGEQQMEIALNSNEASFVSSSSTYSRNYSGSTDIGAGIVFGTQQILASVAARQLANHPRADVPQVMVILTDATPSQILTDASLLTDAQAAKDAGIILVFVAIQEAQQDPIAVDRLEAAASLDQNGDPFIITAANYSDIGPATIADLLNEIREAAAAGLLPPIVIDLDGDGTEFLDIDHGIHFDVDGDGDLEQVAWAGHDDAVLVYDENGNNDVDGVHEISFSRYSDSPNATDLDGLRHFDTNNDLILDANDAEFESFKLWQDRDGDGIVGDGEMMTLTEAGIHSLELVSDNSPYYTAGGDVQVHGTATVHYEDGTTGTLADAEFGYRELIEVNDSIEIVTSDGDVLDLSGGGSGALPSSEVVSPDLVEPSSFAPVESDGSDLSSGAAPATSLEDDMATAGATMG